MDHYNAYCAHDGTTIFESMQAPEARAYEAARGASRTTGHQVELICVETGESVLLGDEIDDAPELADAPFDDEPITDEEEALAAAARAEVAASETISHDDLKKELDL